MAQPAKKSSARKSSAKKTAAKRSSAKKSTAKKSATKKKSTAKRSTAKKSSPKKGASKRSSKRARQSTQDFSGKSVADFRQALTERLVEPLNLVMLTRDRIEETVEDAVSRGSMTRDAAQDLIAGLVERGRRQTTDVLGDLEQLLGRSRGSESVAARARKQVGDATARARDAGDQVLGQVDRARRVAGVGPSFPIMGYDDLTVGQVQTRLDTLTPAELRKVRDYEKRNANRKSVLSAIESKLA
jgi:polyhydroxyalkanoate synthesis regulator phasin